MLDRWTGRKTVIHRFCTGSGVRHRPSKKSGIDGSFVTKNKGKKGKKKYIGIFRLVLEGNYKKQNVFWMMMRMMICLHLCVAKNWLQKITLKLFYFLVWV